MKTKCEVCRGRRSNPLSAQDDLKKLLLPRCRGKGFRTLRTPVAHWRISLAPLLPGR
jgi:hypothetical protein